VVEVVVEAGGSELGRGSMGLTAGE